MDDQFVAFHGHDPLVPRQAGLAERSDLGVGDEPPADQAPLLVESPANN
jgi:hypothetical protein